MRYKVLVEGPVLTQSGYGEHSRLVLRTLRDREDILDIYVSPLNWGATGWILGDSEQRKWIDELLQKQIPSENPQDFFDIHIHIGIPHEFTRKGKFCTHVTAGIETTKVSKAWIAKTHEMDRVVVPSEFAKWGFENTKHPFDVDDGSVRNVGCGAPVKCVNYPHRTLEVDKDFQIDLETDFNYLIVAQWSVRKNLEQTITMFVDEFKNENVGLVIKTNQAKNSIIDREQTKQRLNALLSKYDKDKLKCKIYLLHGSLSLPEMNALYSHPKIKAIISATHGEGFGLPLFEASYNELPVIAPGWSGHLDFLYGPLKGKNGKIRKKPLFARVDYILAPVQKEAVWENIIIKNSMWCFPNVNDFKKKLRAVKNNHGMYKSWAKILKKEILQNNSEEETRKKMFSAMLPDNITTAPDFIFVSDMFAAQYAGGAELSLQTIMENSPSKHVGAVNSELLNKDIVDQHKNLKWVFGNVANLKSEIIEYVISSGIEYSFIEFDYKFCKHRNPVLYDMVEGEPCNYAETDKGKLMTKFANSAASMFFMSENQMKIHQQSLPELRKDNAHVLSSLFTQGFFDYVDQVKEKYKNKKKTKWLVMGSNSWVKGVQESKDWCEEQGLEYEVIQGLSPEEFIDKLAQAKGLCFKPSGLDTCPRLVIEAKLLGCELSLNENVQHSGEKWFSGDEQTMKSYLLNRPSFFWEHAFEK